MCFPLERRIVFRSNPAQYRGALSREFVCQFGDLGAYPLYLVVLWRERRAEFGVLPPQFRYPHFKVAGRQGRPAPGAASRLAEADTTSNCDCFSARSDSAFDRSCCTWRSFSFGDIAVLPCVQ